jgi:hypothetical protein
MSKYVIDSSTLTSIGNAIREKDGTTAAILVSNFPARIKAIETGGGTELPRKAYYIEGDCSYMFRYGHWDWFVETFGDKIVTYDYVNTTGITNASNMFLNSGLKSIPFEINLRQASSSSNFNMANMFKDCVELRTAPIIKFTTDIAPPTSSSAGTVQLGSLFSGCNDLREIDNDFFNRLFTEEYAQGAVNQTGANSARGSMFYNCYSLRKLPDLHRAMTGGTGSYNLYQYLANYCRCLDEVVNLPVHPSNSTTSNMFASTVSDCCRLKRFTFEMQADGSPYVRTWKNQNIYLARNCGYGGPDLQNILTKYNTGLTTATKIYDDESYQRFKDNENAWAYSADYSRYNHDSAVETINSLPDCSSGSGNTVTFYGTSGAKTDGGAVNTLTEEEIAVAVAKGWTVTLT